MVSWEVILLMSTDEWDAFCDIVLLEVLCKLYPGTPIGSVQMDEAAVQAIIAQSSFVNRYAPEVHSNIISMFSYNTWKARTSQIMLTHPK